MRSTALVAALGLSVAACTTASGPEDPTAIDPRFVRFQLAEACPSGQGCATVLILYANGQLVRGEGTSRRTAQASPTDLAAAVRLVTAPVFVALLETPVQCQTHRFESMALELLDGWRAQPDSACRTQPLVEAVRAEMRRLTSVYFP